MDNYLLQANDELTIFLNIKKPNLNFLKASIKVPIFYEDDNIIIFDKPKNLSCQENANEKNNTLNNYLRKYCYQKNYWDGYDKESEPALIHRLDHNTTGLIVAAKNKPIARILNDNLHDEITKKYLTVIYGRARREEALLQDYIYQDETKTNQMIVTRQPSKITSPIKTWYQVVDRTPQYSILEVKLLTGKKHQIRAHLAFYKMYIVGDSKYGIKNHNLKITSQVLVSNQIIFHLHHDSLKYLNDKKFIKYTKPEKILEEIN